MTQPMGWTASQRYAAGFDEASCRQSVSEPWRAAKQGQRL